MKKQEFADVINKLSLAYDDKFEFSREKIDLWWNFFHTLERDVFENAVMESIATSKYPPTIAEIRSLCVKRLEGDKLYYGRLYNALETILGYFPGVLENVEGFKKEFWRYLSSKPKNERYVYALKIEQSVKDYFDNNCKKDIGIPHLNDLLNVIEGDNQ